MTKEFKTYRGSELLKGVDDLLPEFIFVGNSQGDTTATNSLLEYLGSGGWLSSLINPVPETQREIDVIVGKNKKKNSDYIKELKLSGEYKKPIGCVTISMLHDPKLDNKNNIQVESYKYDIFNLKMKK